MAAHCAWTDGPCWPATGSSCNLERPIGRVCAFFLPLWDQCSLDRRGNGKEENGSLTGRFSHTCVRCETKCSLDERENVSALPGKFSLRPLRDQMLAGQKRKQGREKMGAWPGDFSHCVRCETKCSLDERENVSALPGKFSLCVRCETKCSLDKRGNREEENGSLTGRFSHTASAVRPMLAGRKRKRKCSTGKVLTASAARPDARWPEEETGRGKWELDREIFSHCVRCETKCSLDERENVSALPGKFSLRPLRDQMLAGQKEETGKRKMELDREIFSHCVRCETKCSLDEEKT